jgi:hypothetical protein
MRYRHFKRPPRVSPGFAANPGWIVPLGDAERVVRWHHDGVKYALGYQRYPRLFGERQRGHRKALKRSMEQVMWVIRHGTYKEGFGEFLGK